MGDTGTEYSDSYTVQFTDQANHKQTGTISQCDYTNISATPGDSIAIVYVPDDSSTIGPLDDLKSTPPVWPFIVGLVGLITVIFLFSWIRKRRAHKTS